MISVISGRGDLPPSPPPGAGVGKEEKSEEG
jgi:hypothetical protein